MYNPLIKDNLDKYNSVPFSKIGYNTFFTLFLFPIFWFLFNIYQMSFIGGQDA